MLSDAQSSSSQRTGGPQARGLWWGLVLIFLAVNVPTLYNGHNWGDDFAQYLHHAQNILQGKPYSDGIMLDRGLASPVGFPLMLTPLLLSGGDLAALKIHNIIFWVLYVWAITALARRFESGRENLLIAAFLFSSPFIFIFKQNILTDVPFTAVSTAAIACFLRWREGPPAAPGARRWFWMGLAFAAWGLLLRWSGAILFVALLLTPGVLPKRRKEFFLVFGVLAVCSGFSLMAGSSFLFHLQEARLSCSAWGTAVLANLRTIFTDMLFFVFPLKTRWMDLLLDGIGGAVFWMGLIFAAGLLLELIVRLRRRDLELDYSFLMLYFLALVLWPIAGGGRYVLPVVGLIILQAARGWRQIFPQRWAGKVLQLLLVLLIAYNVLSIQLHFDFNDDAIGQPRTAEMLQWVKTQVPVQERLMFFKPRALGLLTAHAVAAYAVPGDPRSIAQRIRDYDIKWFVFSRWTPDLKMIDYYRSDTPFSEQTKELSLVYDPGNEEISNEIGRQGVKIHEVWKNDKYVIFRIGS